MKRWWWLPVLAGVVLMLLAASGAPQPSVLIYTGAAYGKLKPCACSPETDMGGLLRRDTLLADLRNQYPRSLLVDAGGTFHEVNEQARLGAQALLEALRKLRYQTVAIGATDLVYGRSFLEEHGADMLFVSNVRWKDAAGGLSQPRRVVELDGQKVELFALIDPADVYTGRQADIEVEPIDKFLDQHAKPGVLSIALLAGKRETAQAVLTHPRIEIVINAFHAEDILDQPQYSFADGKVLAETGIFGSRVGLLRFTFRGEKLLTVENKHYELDNKIVDGELIKPLYDWYDGEVKKLFLAKLAGKPAFDQEKSPYVGSETCGKCHKRSFRIWRAMNHSHALESLKKVNKHFDAECIACHVIGWEQAGGFHSEQESPHLANVGCEACHGPGKAHVKNWRVKMTPFTRNDCVRCHNAERSPAFKPEPSWEKIKH